MKAKKKKSTAGHTAESYDIPEYVIREIETEYKKAQKQPWVNKPLAYALYQVWKAHDRTEVSRNGYY